MAQQNPDEYKQELLINRITTALGFERLSDWIDEQSETLPRIPPSYLLVCFVLIVDIGFLQSYSYVTNKTTIADNPGKIFVIACVVLAVIGIRWMHQTYAQSIVNLELPERDLKNDREIKKRFKQLLSFRVEVGAYLVALALLYVNLFLFLGLSTVVEIDGPVRALVKNFLVLPVYMLLASEFAVLYLSIHVLLPKRIFWADLNMFFYDPQNMGGFGTVGELLKRSYYVYTVGLLSYFGVAYWPQIFGDILNIEGVYPEPVPIVGVFFTVFWVIGVCSIGYSMYRMHALMTRKKQEAIRDIEEDIMSQLEDPFDITTDHIEDSELRAEFEHKVAEIRNTRQYPSTFTMWSQILISVLLPQAMQVALQVLP